MSLVAVSSHPRSYLRIGADEYRPRGGESPGKLARCIAVLAADGGRAVLDRGRELLGEAVSRSIVVIAD